MAIQLDHAIVQATDPARSAQRLAFWADPRQQRPGEIKRDDGGRGIHCPDPGGDDLEVTTAPYDGGAG